MSQEVLLRGFFVFLICGIVAYCSYFREDKESGSDYTDSKGQRYSNYLPMDALPLFILFLFTFSLFYYGWERTVQLMLSWCFGTFWHISMFYLVVLLLLPVMRKYFSARSCAELWMLPTLFYMAQHSFMSLPEPMWVIELPKYLVQVLLVVWALGFAVVFLWQILSHLIFRHRILRHAVPVWDAEVLDVWQAERANAGFHRNYRLVISPDVRTPLSIGLFQKTIRVVLPVRAYTTAELQLILRHELIHIGHGDSGTKFFMMFCTAVCWFNPLMWTAMRKSAEDLELSCDETVLIGADPETRHQYAELILCTAGENRGFTTSLSSSASALRYRLGNIVKQKKTLNGGLIVGLVLFVFLMTSGYVALGYDSGTGEDIIFYSGTAQAHTIRSINFGTNGDFDFYDCTDETAFKNYLCGLEFTKITGNYTFPEKEHQMTVILMGPEGAFGAVLTDISVKIVPLYTGRTQAEYYYLKSQVDWDSLFSLLRLKKNDEEAELPEQPEMMLSFRGDRAADGEPIACPGVIINTTVDGKVQDGSLDPQSVPAALQFTDIDATEVTLSFSHAVYQEYTVQVETWDHASMDFIGLDDYTSPDTFRLAPYDAHYMVGAVFQMDDGKVIEMVFRFDVDLSEKEM